MQLRFHNFFTVYGAVLWVYCEPLWTDVMSSVHVPVIETWAKKHLGLVAVDILLSYSTNNPPNRIVVSVMWALCDRAQQFEIIPIDFGEDYLEHCIWEVKKMNLFGDSGPCSSVDLLFPKHAQIQSSRPLASLELLGTTALL